MNDSKENEKFAKLRIHYKNNKYAEIKVFENTDPDHLTESFCNKYRLGNKMRQQLKSIIIRRLETLRPQSVLPSEHIEEEKESYSDNSKHDHPSGNPNRAKTIREVCLEENTPTNTSGYFNEADNDQTSSALPLPELNISTKD